MVRSQYKKFQVFSEAHIHKNRQYLRNITSISIKVTELLLKYQTPF